MYMELLSLLNVATRRPPRLLLVEVAFFWYLHRASSSFGVVSSVGVVDWFGLLVDPVALPLDFVFQVCSLLG